MKKEQFLALAKNGFKYVDLRFTDLRGKEHHVTVPASEMNDGFIKNGKMFDGSSIAGWRSINNSDMILMPDLSTAVMDPFFDDPTLILTCDVIDPQTMKGYELDPRLIAHRAEAYLKKSGIGDTSYFGPEPEFFIFDDVRWKIDMHTMMYTINSEEAAWASSEQFPEGNLAHRPGIKGGYFPVPPVDSSQNIRSAMCNILEQMGFVLEAHHHEVATSNQNEIATRYNTLLKKADELQRLKYVVLNVADQWGRSATFMPKPIVGDNGNGMHCHQSLAKNGVNLFTGNGYAGLSDLALSYIAGIIKHARALNAFTNSTTNSYKRLVPGFEAPTMLAYSSCNRSASIRVPHTPDVARRIEVRFPDALSNPYIAFSAMLMAGLDGIKNNLSPGDPRDQNLYELSDEESKDIPRVCHSLDQAMECLDKDRDFLLAGGVFSNEFIDNYIKLKHQEITRLMVSTHPVEFDMYYSG